MMSKGGVGSQMIESAAVGRDSGSVIYCRLGAFDDYREITREDDLF